MERLLDEEFQNDLLHNLNELRKSNILCDTTIKTEGEDFPAHRCVLTAASPYFRALFTSDFKENESSFVELKNINSAILSELLQFTYTGEAKTDSSNAQDLIMAADFLMLPSLKSKASSFLEGTISASNCLALESFASQFNCESLKQAAVTYTMENFLTVVKSDDFKSLEFEKMKDFISRDEIVVSKEEDVYEVVILWVKHDLSSRECLFPELLKLVRAFSLSKYSIREILNKEELVVKSPACTSILVQGLEAFLFPDSLQALLQRPRLCLKTEEPVVVLTGGHGSSSGAQYDTLGYVLATKKWCQLPAMPFSRTKHAAAVSGGQLYVVGGHQWGPLSYFNPAKNKWFNTDKRLPGNEHGTFVTHNEELYMIGGDDEQHNGRHQVKKYNCKLMEWEELPSMKFPRVAHCAVSLEEFIYVIAGSDGSSCLKSVECYNPSIDQWMPVPDMMNARRLAAAATIGGRKILVVGGCRDMSCGTIEVSCEIFNKSLNQWSLVSSPIEPRAACGIVSTENFVYLFGGKDANSELGSVECYVVQEDTWKHVSTMPKERSCLQASLLKLPVKYIKRG